MRKRRFALMTLSVSIAATSLIAGQQKDTAGLPERFTAFAVSLGGPRTTSGTAQVEIVIDRWSTDTERARLLKSLKEGQDALLDSLRDLKPVGSIRTPGTIAYDLHYANQTAADNGGRRIFLATDRPIGFWEAANRPRTINYPFTFIELRMKGEGEGKLSLAARVTASEDGRYVELENYAAQPVMLNEVKLFK
jgi:hypothetical protein